MSIFDMPPAPYDKPQKKLGDAAMKNIKIGSKKLTNDFFEKAATKILKVMRRKR